MQCSMMHKTSYNIDFTGPDYIPDYRPDYTVGFHNFNLRFFDLRVSHPIKLIVDVFVDTMSDFNVPGSRPNKNTMKFRKIDRIDQTIDQTIAQTRLDETEFDLDMLWCGMMCHDTVRYGIARYAMVGHACYIIQCDRRWSRIHCRPATPKEIASSLAATSNHQRFQTTGCYPCSPKSSKHR